MADTPKHSVSVAGIVVDDQDRVLVIQRRDNGDWEPPGGVLEIDETPECGVAREVLEETGVAVDVGTLSGVYKNMEKAVVSLVFRCIPNCGKAGTSMEAVAVEWRTLIELKQLMKPAYYVRVEDAFSPNVHVRAHDGVMLMVGTSS